MAKEYIVKSGDTLSRIAESNKTNLSTLVQLNSIQDPNKISVGQKIILPGNSYEDAIKEARSQLESGVTWGTAWWNVKNAVPEADNAKIDKDLNKDFWAKPGAYETFKAEKTQPFSLDLNIDTGTAQSTPAFIPPKKEPEKKPEPDVQIIEPTVEDKKVEIVEPKTDDTQVTIVDTEGVPVKKPTAAPTLDLGLKPETGTSLSTPQILEPTKPKTEITPIGAFFDRLIAPYLPDKSKAEEFKTRVESGDKISFQEMSDYARELTRPLLEKVIPQYRAADKAAAAIVNAIPNTIKAYNEGKLVIEKEKLEQEARTGKEKVNQQKLFMIRGASNVELDKIDPQSFYRDESGGILIPADALKGISGTDYEKEEYKRESELAEKRDAFDDIVFNLEVMREDWEKETGIVMTGEENEMDFRQKMEDAFNKLTDDIYKKYNLEGNELAKQVNEHATKLNNSLATVADLIESDIEGIFDFSFKDAPKDIVDKSNEGFFDLIKDVESYNEYVKSAKDFNDYNDILATAVIDEEKAEADAARLEEELRVLRTNENNKFIEDQYNLDKLNEVQFTAHVNYYWQNQKDIERIYDVSKELSDIYSWMEINYAKAVNAQKRAEAIGKAIENFSNDFVDLVATKEFGDLLSSYATEKDKDVSELIGALNEYNRSKQWLDENADNVSKEMLKYEAKEAAALSELQAGAEKINKFAEDYALEMAKAGNAAKELEKLQKVDEIAYYKMKSEINSTINASRLLHPFKTWDLWKEHGAKEVIWEGVPHLLSAMMETAIKGAKATKVPQSIEGAFPGTGEAVMKALSNHYKMIQEDLLPDVMTGIRESLKIVKYVGGSIDSAAVKMNDWLNDGKVLAPFADENGNMKPSMAVQFATWALSYISDADEDSALYKDMKTRYDKQTAVLPVDPGDEGKTYTIDEIMEQYGSRELQQASGLVFTTKDGLKNELIKANDFKGQGIDPNKIPAGTEVVISVGNNNASQFLINQEKNRIWLSGQAAYDVFTTTKESSIYDFVKREDRDKVIAISMFNDLAGKGISLDKIPKGTELKIPKFDSIPTMISWMAPEKRLELEARNPFWAVFWNELAANLGDPVNYLWPMAAFKFGDFVDFAGGKLTRELAEAAAGASPTGKVTEFIGKNNMELLAKRGQSIVEWTHGLSEILRLKPVSNPKLARVADNTPFLQLLKPEFGLDNQANLATLSVLMTKFRGITLSKMLPWYQKKLIDMTDIDVNAEASRSIVDTKTALAEIAAKNKIARELVSEAMTMFVDDYTTNKNVVIKKATEYTQGYKNIKDWLETKGGTGRDKKKIYVESVLKDKEAGLFKNEAEFKYALEEPEEFYSEFYRRNKDIRVVDIAWEFMEKTGLSEGQFRKFLEEVPDMEQLMDYIEKHSMDYIENRRYKSIFFQEKYNNLSPAGKMAYRELLQDPESGMLIPNQKVFDETKAALLERYPDQRDEILRGVKALEDYKADIEWVRKYEQGEVALEGRENDKVLIPVGKDNNVELRTVEVETLPKDMKINWAPGERYKLAENPSTGKATFVANISAYKDGGLPMIMADYGSVASTKKISILYNKPIGRAELSLAKKSVSEGKLLSDFIEQEAKDVITYGDILNTAFMDKDIGWFTNYFKDAAKGEEFRSEFVRIVDDMVKAGDIKANEVEEFISKKSVARGIDERSMITNNPGSNRLYNVTSELGTKVTRYLNIEKFYELVEKLKALYDADPTHSLYRQLYDKLSVLKRNTVDGTTKHPIQPVQEMMLLLMGIKGKNARPDFLDNFSLIKALLSQKRLSSEEWLKVSKKLKDATYKMIRNKTNAKIERKASGMTPGEITMMKSEVKKKIVYFDSEERDRDEFAAKLGEEMAAINKSLPEKPDKTFTTEELRQYSEIAGDDDFYYIGNVIPKLFTYVTLQKVGKEALLDNIVKLSKELNSTAIETIADIMGKERSYVLNVVDESTETLRKVRDSKVMYPTRPRPDSKTMLEAVESFAKNYGYNNDIAYVLKESPEHTRLPSIEDEITTLSKQREKLVPSSVKKELDSISKKQEALSEEIIANRKKIKDIDRQIASLEHEAKQLIPDDIKKKINSLDEKMKSPSKWLEWHTKDLDSLHKQLVLKMHEYAVNRHIPKIYEEVKILRAKISELEKKAIAKRGEVNSLYSEIKKLVPRTGKTKEINNKISDLVLARIDPEIEIETAQGKYQIISSDVYSKIPTETKNSIIEIEKKIDKLQEDASVIRSQPETVPSTLHDRSLKIKPGESFAVEFADGRTETIVNNLEVHTSPHKLLRQALESRAGYEKGSLYHHLKILREKLRKGDKYVVLGEELPETFVNDLAAIDMALNLDKLESGIYDKNYFADKKTLDKLYKFEIDAAEKKRDLNRVLDKIYNMEQNLNKARLGGADDAKLRDMTSAIKTEKAKIKDLRSKYEIAKNKGDEFANATGIGVFNQFKSTEGNSIFELKDRYQRFEMGKHSIDRKEYEPGVTVISKDVVDSFNSVKAKQKKAADGELVDNPLYNKVIQIDDYTDYGKGVIQFLKDNPKLYVEGRDYEIVHVADALDNQTTASALAAAIRDTNSKSLFNVFTDKNWGYGISDEDMLELMSMAKRLKQPTYKEHQIVKKYPGDVSFERMFSEDEKKLINEFVSKLDDIYRRKGPNESDKVRNEVWNAMATKRDVFEETKSTQVLAEIEESKASTRLRTQIDDYDPNSIDADDDYKFVEDVDNIVDEKVTAEDLLEYNIEASDETLANIDNLKGRYKGKKHDEKYDRTYPLDEGRAREYAIHVMEQLNAIKETMGWIDIQKVDKNWTVNSVRSTYALENVQTKLLHAANGQYIDNGDLLPAVKASAEKAQALAQEGLSASTREFFELLPDIYGARSARSLADFEASYEATVDVAEKAIDGLQKLYDEKQSEHLALTNKLRTKLKDAKSARDNLKYELNVKRLSKIKDEMSKFDPIDKEASKLTIKKATQFHVRTRNLKQLDELSDKMNIPAGPKAEIKKQINEAKFIKEKLDNIEKVYDSINNNLKELDASFSRSTESLLYDIEFAKSKASISASIDNVLSGTYKPKGKSPVQVKEFTAQFVRDINGRMQGIARQKKSLAAERTRKRHVDKERTRQIDIELAALSREASRLEDLTKVAVQWNATAANGIKFTAKEIYNAGNGIYERSYIDKMRELSKLLARNKDGSMSKFMLRAYESLDVYFPTVKLGDKEATYMKALGGDWFKKWFLDADRKHPAEITLPKVDYQDLARIDLNDSKKAVEQLTGFFEKVKEQRTYPTIIDLDGKLKIFIDRKLPQYSKRVYIIDSNTFKDNLRTIIPGRGVHVSSGELAALKELKHLFEFRQGIWLFGKNKHGVTMEELGEAFFNKALSKNEAKALKEIHEHHDVLVAKAMPTEDITTLPQTLSRSIQNEAMKLVGSDKNGKITHATIRANLDQISRLSNRFANQVNILKALQKSGISFQEAAKKTFRSVEATGGDVMMIGAHETLITDATRSAIDDAIELGMKFHFPTEMTPAERAMKSYVKESGGKIAKQTHDLSREFKIGTKNTPGMVIFNGRDALAANISKDRTLTWRRVLAKTFKEKAKKTPLYSDSNVIEFRSLKELSDLIQKELYDMTDKFWLKDENKVAPRFLKEESRYKFDSDELLSRWVQLRRKDKIREDFQKVNAENIRRYRNEQIQAMREYYGRELDKWEIDYIESQVDEVKQITRLINDYVFRFDMPDKISNRIKSAVIDKILYWTTLPPEDADASEIKAWWYKRVDDFILQTTVAKDITKGQLLNRLKSIWVWNVLLLRPSWYLWNNLGDSVRAVFGARDIAMLKDLQKGYINASEKYIRKVGRELTEDAAINRAEKRLRDILKKYDPKSEYDIRSMQIDELTGAIQRLQIPNDIRQIAKKEIDSLKELRQYRVFNVKEEPGYTFTHSDDVDSIINFNFRQGINPDTGVSEKYVLTPRGEVVDEKTLEWITSSGLVQATTDPTYTRGILASMPDKTFWDRVMKRSRVFQGDLEMHASQLEEMRRQTMAFYLLFNKAYSVAQTEKIIKKYLFDYRDITYAGQLMRTIFPFYTFHIKSLQLYFSMLAKAGPGAIQAGQALLEAMENESAAMPEYMKDRIELDFLGLKGQYLLPHLGIIDHFEMILNPMAEIQRSIQNPLNMAFGLGFGPGQAAIIEAITGQGYFDRTLTVDQLRALGWSMSEINDYMRENELSKDLKDKPNAWLVGYAKSLFPLAEFLKKMVIVENDHIKRNISWHQSQRVKELFKFFGINIKEMKDNSIDEIAYVWNALNSLPPSLVNVYKKRFERENPELWKYFEDYAASSWMKKINSMTDDELKYREGITKIEAATVRKYYDMESDKEGSGDTWLANTPAAKDILERYWATKGDKESHEAGLKKFESGQMKALVSEILSHLGNVSAEKIAALDAMGIKHPYTKALDKQAMYNDFYDMNGELKVRSAEDIVTILEKYGVMGELAEIMSTKEKLGIDYAEYEKLSVEEKDALAKDNAKYYHVKNIVNNALPSNIDEMSEAEAAPYWAKWNQLRDTLIYSNPEYKKRYLEETPLYQQQYLSMNSEYNSRWNKIISGGEGDVNPNFYKDFYDQPEWFRERYFAKYPDKKIYYPVAKAYTDLIGSLVEQREKTGEWDSAKQLEALDLLWKHQEALKLWDKQEIKHGLYNYVDKQRQVLRAQLDDDTLDYFDLFYQHKGDKGWDDYREYYFSKPENEYKRITYPFTQTWVNLIKKDDENGTNFSSEWFWSPKNEEARQLYGKYHPLEDGKNKLDYQTKWKEFSGKIAEDPAKIYDLVLSADNWFKNEYFRNHPDRKEYYPLALELSKYTPEQHRDRLEQFFLPGNKSAIEAWERDKPGTIAYNRFRLDIYEKTDELGRGSMLDWFFEDQNKAMREEYEKRSPGVTEAYKLWQQYAKIEGDSWLGRKNQREFLKQNPKLQEWWNRFEEDDSEAKALRIKEQTYYAILDRVSADGKGRQYYEDYFKAKADAQKYLDDNPDLKAARADRIKNMDKAQTTIQKLVDEYNGLTLQEDKNEFLKKHPDVDSYLLNQVPPGMKKIWLTQRAYFNITDPDSDEQRKLRQDFLALHPELVEYWEVSRLPGSYYTDKATFEKYQTEFNKANDFFSEVRNGNWSTAEKLKGKLPSSPPDIRTEEGRWLYNKLYNEAMSTWATTFGTYMSTYYFRSLPSWLRAEYYSKHPESKIISYTPMSRSLNNAVVIQNSTHPDLTWARRMMQKYGKNIPSSIDKQVQRIMVKWGEWDERSNWSSTQWSDWWEARTARLNGLRAKDLAELPLLQKELRRAQKMFSYSMLPIRNKRIHGIINPFLGASVMLPELTVDLKNDIIKNNKVY